ncbi:MAG: hypothetical protein LBL63_06930, partial [Clostridiales Family XIII bacterium]|nr:hypothetical protein [Clostridiales Family XIII bacterium]
MAKKKRKKGATAVEASQRSKAAPRKRRSEIDHKEAARIKKEEARVKKESYLFSMSHAIMP